MHTVPIPIDGDEMNVSFRLLVVLMVWNTALPAWGKLNVVTTLPDYGALIRSIGGDHVRVKVLSSPLQDPHYVDAKPSFIVALNQADLLVSNGLELEIGWLPNLVVQARNPNIHPGQPGHLQIASHIKNILEVPKGRIDRSMGDIHGGGNPHYYHDPLRMGQLLPTLAQRLSQLDPSHQTEYAQNQMRAKKMFDAFIQEAQRKFQTLSATQRRVVGYHKSLNYLFETLNIQVVAFLEPKPGVSPTPSHVAKVLSLMKKQNIKTIIQEAHYGSKTSATLAQLVNGNVVQIVGGTNPNESYLDHLQTVTDKIYHALKNGRP